MQPPRSYNRITAEWDAADGGFAGEVWRYFITRLSTNWWGSATHQRGVDLVVITLFSADTPDVKRFAQVN
jgi:hypothetical protein